MRDKYRIRFTKDGAMRFIGHLDLLNLFQRAIKRANLPIAYSAGFNPHQQMSFGLPLPIGMSSTGEYVDLEFDCPVDTSLLVRSLNEEMPSGLTAVSARAMEKGEKSSAALTEAAAYEIILPRDIELAGYVSEILAAKEIIVMKKTKSGEGYADIRCDIFTLEFSEGNKLLAVLAAGSNRSLKPSLLVDYLCKLAQSAQAAGEAIDPLEIKYKRLNLLQKTAAGFEGLDKL